VENLETRMGKVSRAASSAWAKSVARKPGRKECRRGEGPGWGRAALRRPASYVWIAAVCDQFL